MARATIVGDKSRVVVDNSHSVGKGAILQVITGGVTVYFSFGKEATSELETGNDGVPVDGFMMTSISGIIVFPDFADIISAMCAKGQTAQVFAMDFQARQQAQRSARPRTYWEGRALRAAGL